MALATTPRHTVLLVERCWHYTKSRVDKKRLPRKRNMLRALKASLCILKLIPVLHNEKFISQP